jgi:nucleoprotein TPR
VVAHADSIKAVADLRVQLTAANDASRTNAATAETAQAKLAASEVSWRQQKDALEKEVSDLNTRYVLLYTVAR